jgi:flagellar hook-associated protein 3 FlgL
MSKTEGYQANIEHAQSSLFSTESALSHIEELMQEAKDQILVGNTGTASADERKIVATELRSIQDQLLQTLNSNASGVYYFGGTNTGTKPFTIVGDKLHYNGRALDDPSGTGVASANEALIKTMKSDAMYVDIGLGASIIPDPTDPTGTTVDPSTVFKYSIPGISVVGSGEITLSDGTTKVPNNLYDLLGTIAENLESGSYTYSTVDELYGKFSDAAMEIVYNLTEVGSRTSYLDFMTNRFETRTLDLQEQQVNVESADPANTIIKFKTQEVAYNAALQMGTKIIQPSIFDFMS